MFEGTFYWSSFLRKAYAWISEIFREFGIFSNSVKGVWSDPGQHLLIGKVSNMLPFDVWRGLELIFVDLRQLFFGQQKFQRPNPLFSIFGQDLLDGISAVSDLDLKLRE